MIGIFKAEWTPVKMLDLRRFKEVIVSYGMYSPFAEKMLNLWSTCNRIISQNWKDLVIAVLDPGPQLQWRTCWKDEARAGGIDISQDQLLGEGDYANVQR